MPFRRNLKSWFEYWLNMFCGSVVGASLEQDENLNKNHYVNTSGNIIISANVSSDIVLSISYRVVREIILFLKLFVIPSNCKN